MNDVFRLQKSQSKFASSEKPRKSLSPNDFHLHTFLQIYQDPIKSNLSRFHLQATIKIRNFNLLSNFFEYDLISQSYIKFIFLKIVSREIYYLVYVYIQNRKSDHVPVLCLFTFSFAHRFMSFNLINLVYTKFIHIFVHFLF